VHRYALAQGQSEADAAEPSQEAALELTQRPKSASRFRRKWLISLARECLHRVQEGRIQSAGIDLDGLEAPGAEDRESLKRLWGSVLRLPPKQAGVFIRCEVLGMPPAAVASELGHRVNYVHLLDSRARQRLRLEWIREEEKISRIS